jgi:hypothetical protein
MSRVWSEIHVIMIPQQDKCGFLGYYQLWGYEFWPRETAATE